MINKPSLLILYPRYFFECSFTFPTSSFTLSFHLNLERPNGIFLYQLSSWTKPFLTICVIYSNNLSLFLVISLVPPQYSDFGIPSTLYFNVKIIWFLLISHIFFQCVRKTTKIIGKHAFVQIYYSYFLIK